MESLIRATLAAALHATGFVHTVGKPPSIASLHAALSQWLAVTVRSHRLNVVAANNQHKLKEEIPEGQPLAETSFFRAMLQAKGTVSIVDDKVMVPPQWKSLLSSITHAVMTGRVL